MNEDQIDQIKELMLIGYTIGAAMEKLGIDNEWEDIIVQPPNNYMGAHDDETHEGTN